MASYSGRYARALFLAGKDEGAGKEFHNGNLLSVFISSLAENQDLRNFLVGVHVGKMQKKKCLDEIFTDTEDRLFLNFLKVLVDKERMGIIDHIGLDYRRLELDSQRILEAVIETAFPLDAETVKQVEATFRKKTGASEIRSTVRIVPELIGGIRVIIGSTVYDGSTRSELNRLHEKMSK